MTTPKPFQWDGAKGIHAFDGRSLLADEMGLGKTFQVLLYLLKYQPKRPVIVVTPAAAKYSWEHEAKHHFGLLTEVVSGRKMPRKARLANLHAPIIVINYEILHNWVDYLIELRPICVVWDEAHYIGNPKTIRFKALEFLINEARVPYRIALSGTPLTNRPSELWTTLHLLRPDLYGSLMDFGMEYCQPKIVRGIWSFTGAKNLDKLHVRLKTELMIRRLKKDVAKELPEKVRKLIPIELDKEARDEYDFCARHFITWLKLRHPGKVHAALKAPHLVQMGYLLRLCAKLKRFTVAQWIDDFVAESDSKIVIFSGHTKMIEWLERRYAGQCVVINGEITGRKRHDAIQRFQKDPSIRFAFCNPKAAGVAITLTAANVVCYTDFPYAPGTVKQGEDRIHRIGQTKKCYIYFLAARRTIEEKLCDLLATKQHILDQVLDGIDNGQDFDIFEELWRYVRKDIAA